VVRVLAGGRGGDGGVAGVELSPFIGDLFVGPQVSHRAPPQAPDVLELSFPDGRQLEQVLSGQRSVLVQASTRSANGLGEAELRITDLEARWTLRRTLDGGL
jgi:hypothetical protein